MRNDVKDRLIRCFAAVFDQVDEDAIPSMRSEVANEAWDSLANVMLMSVVQQEFSVEISPEEAKSLDSFEKLLERVMNDDTAR
jgi:acyl carrier protein